MTTTTVPTILFYNKRLIIIARERVHGRLTEFLAARGRAEVLAPPSPPSAGSRVNRLRVYDGTGEGGGRGPAKNGGGEEKERTDKK